MASWKIITFMCIATVYADSKWYQHQKREIKSSICDPIQNNTNKIQCYCGRVSKTPLHIVNADCSPTVKNVSEDDSSWEGFIILQNVTKLTITNAKGVPLNYIPTNALKHTRVVQKLDIKYCHIENIEPYAFANLSLVKDITLRDNQIRTLSLKAFAHHPSLKTLSLDQNNVAEINRDVFVDLPSLQQLFLTGNKITTIHDRAFIQLINLKELEIDKNSIFSLNSETFSGLKNLEKLELSSNSLEVIGDNTFVPLINLNFLNLGDNKIQMLDERAFNGLANLRALSLPNNKISAIVNEKVFEPLIRLNSLSLKDNEIRVIKPEAIAPLMNNFYNTTAQISLEGNHLPCDCSLDVFKPIINKTQNERMRLEIQNLQCYPSEEVKQKWDKFQEIEKTSGQVFEDEELQENGAYEYYDEAELNGTLFYYDMRQLLNCSGESTQLPEATVSYSTPENILSSTRTDATPKSTKARSSPVHNFASTTPKAPTESTKVSDRGTLDLSIAESTTETNRENKTVESTEHNEIENTFDEVIKRKQKKDSSYTTSRLATVSAKPEDKKGFDDHEMASDEAKPDGIKAHRSIQEEVTNQSKYLSNNSHRYFTFVPGLILLLSFRVLL